MKYSFFVINQTPSGSSMKAVYDESLEQIEWGEHLGYDAVFLAEHAFFPHGKPSPHVILGNIAARTKRLRLGTAVSVLPWHNPIEQAQDYATVDLLSDGRLNFGVGRGLFKGEFDGYGIPWAEAEERFNESLDIILGAWRGEPFSYEGKFYRVPEVTIMPSPVQKPHPPLWQPCLSPSTMEKAVRRGITPILGASLTPLLDMKEKFQQLDVVMKRYGRTDLHKVAHPFIYISDTNQQAREEVKEAVEWFLEDFAAMFTLPPGVNWPKEYEFYEPWARYIRSLDYKTVIDKDLWWVGDAASVRQKIRWLRDECRATYVLAFLSYGGLEHPKVMKSMELFARKVMNEL